ncbi:MAG: archease [Synergistetes bacterium]|nr:archease [Synergistota bacterium]
MIEIVEHTADVGIKIRAETLEDLFKEAAKGLSRLMFSFRGKEPLITEEVTIEIEAEDVEELLVTWLNELIYLFESRELAFIDFEFIEFSHGRLKAKVKCAQISLENVACYVKAATYHGLFVKREKDGWYEATVIFDV